VLLLLPAAYLLLQAVISVRTELVTVPVAVTDDHGHQVPGLIQDNFRVYEEGRLQTIVVFHHGDVPVTLGLIVDHSQSMRPKNAALRTAVSALLQSSRPDDELFGIGFSDRVSLVRAGSGPFTSDLATLTTALTTMPAGGRTALYDGLAEGLEHLQLGHTEKRVLVVVSDGGDNASHETYTQILMLARRSQTVVYAIGLLGTPPADEEEDAGAIERLCRDTGGVAYFPRSIEETATVAARVARDLREQYTLGIVPEARADGGAFRRIDVKVSAAGHGRLHVRTRAGYAVIGDQGKKGDLP
jgi:Ca-activated chloride channel family protein